LDRHWQNASGDDPVTHADSAVRVVINADDLGYSPSVNAAVARALEEGRVSSATLLANGPYLAEALAIVAAYPMASFGVHLNLTEFAPLSPPDALRRAGLLDDRGALHSGLRAINWSPVLAQACFTELDAQITHAKARGLRVTHLDSHHHIHTVPHLFPVILVLQRRHRLPILRNTMNVYPPHNRPPRRLRLAKEGWSWLCRTGARSRLTDVFTSLPTFLDDPCRAEFRAARSIELMAHPGQSGYEDETARLLAPNSAFLPAGFRLCSYAEVFS
jgi:predicted glycoside hydrolase/deacetylase ChbG (UPF0249 family)